MRSLNSVLITGGAGYVGSVLVRKLVSLGYVGVTDDVIQTAFGKLKVLADKILEDNLPVRLQVQLHKIIWGDIRGK